mmetsp:Transcript_53338/g.105189  ORF Transcript_53338/g.105189 Transcript_53338/m.105189 type:complete len:106 (-) Transcript_53338:399-716(-)
MVYLDDVYVLVDIIICRVNYLAERTHSRYIRMRSHEVAVNVSILLTSLSEFVDDKTSGTNRCNRRNGRNGRNKTGKNRRGIIKKINNKSCKMRIASHVLAVIICF